MEVNIKKIIFILTIIIFITLVSQLFLNKKETSAWFYPNWVVNAKYNEPIKVLDTESALGRYSSKTKNISLKELSLIHGHLCDGLIISYIQIKEVLKKLFPDGTIDRTDLRVVSKNGPCWIDAATMMTGARSSFETLSIQNEIGDGFIIQKISTGEAYSVHLKKGVFPKEQAELENKIRTQAKMGEKNSSIDIDNIEKMHTNFSKKLLNTPPDELMEIKKLENYKYKFIFQTGKRGDIINKNIPQTP